MDDNFKNEHKVKDGSKPSDIAVFKKKLTKGDLTDKEAMELYKRMDIHGYGLRAFDDYIQTIGSVKAMQALEELMDSEPKEGLKLYIAYIKARFPVKQQVEIKRDSDIDLAAAVAHLPRDLQLETIMKIQAAMGGEAIQDAEIVIDDNNEK